MAQTGFAEWTGQKIYLALDSSSLWDEFVVVRVALIYRGRALPLSWVILKQQSTTAAFEKYKHILKKAAAILPKSCCVILLADRGFDDNDPFCAARAGSGLGLSHSLEEVAARLSGQYTLPECGSFDASQGTGFVSA